MPILTKCDRCNGSGELALDAATCTAERPGPVPDDARGWTVSNCPDCKGAGQAGHATRLALLEAATERFSGLAAAGQLLPLSDDERAAAEETAYADDGFELAIDLLSPVSPGMPSYGDPLWRLAEIKTRLPLKALLAHTPFDPIDRIVFDVRDEIAPTVVTTIKGPFASNDEMRRAIIGMMAALRETPEIAERLATDAFSVAYRDGVCRITLD